MKVETATDADRHLAVIKRAKDRAKRTGSRMDAVHAFCTECVGGPSKDVYECTSPNCALYPFRRPKKDVKVYFSTRESGGSAIKEASE